MGINKDRIGSECASFGSVLHLHPCAQVIGDHRLLGILPLKGKKGAADSQALLVNTPFNINNGRTDIILFQRVQCLRDGGKLAGAVLCHNQSDLRLHLCCFCHFCHIGSLLSDQYFVFLSFVLWIIILCFSIFCNCGKGLCKPYVLPPLKVFFLYILYVL